MSTPTRARRLRQPSSPRRGRAREGGQGSAWPPKREMPDRRMCSLPPDDASPNDVAFSSAVGVGEWRGGAGSQAQASFGSAGEGALTYRSRKPPRPGQPAHRQQADMWRTAASLLPATRARSRCSKTMEWVCLGPPQRAAADGPASFFDAGRFPVFGRRRCERLRALGGKPGARQFGGGSLGPKSLCNVAQRFRVPVQVGGARLRPCFEVRSGGTHRQRRVLPPSVIGAGRRPSAGIIRGRADRPACRRAHPHVPKRSACGLRDARSAQCQHRAAGRPSADGQPPRRVARARAHPSRVGGVSGRRGGGGRPAAGSSSARPGFAATRRRSPQSGEASPRKGARPACGHRGRGLEPPRQNPQGLRPSAPPVRGEQADAARADWGARRPERVRRGMVRHYQAGVGAWLWLSTA